jgi:hypothetical protein
MNWLKRILRNWLHNGAIGIDNGNNPLLAASDSNNPAALTVIAIENGFLVMSRKYNPNGPDSVSATFATDVDDLTGVLVSRLAQTRLKI